MEVGDLMDRVLEGEPLADAEGVGARRGLLAGLGCVDASLELVALELPESVDD